MSKAKAETKQQQIVEFLRGSDLQHTAAGLASQFECNEGTARRARKAFEAEQIRDEAVANGMDGGEAMGLLKAILAADAVEEIIAGQIEEIKEEVKALKESLADARQKSKDVRVAARERLPLFDGANSRPRLASHAG